MVLREIVDREGRPIPAHEDDVSALGQEPLDRDAGDVTVQRAELDSFRLARPVRAEEPRHDIDGRVAHVVHGDMRVADTQMRLVDRHRPGRGFHLRLKVVNGGHLRRVCAGHRREDKTEHDAENHKPPAHRLLSLLKKAHAS